MSNNRKIRTRIAPSPTGMATIGNIRTALFNYLFAKRHGGEFLLRIEDTDSKRFVKGAEEYIIESLKWLGISPDSGVDENGKATYRQSEKKYAHLASILIKEKLAYFAFDSSVELIDMKKRFGENAAYNRITRMSMKNSFTLSDDEIKERLQRGDKYVIRFDVPNDAEISFNDLIRGKISFHSNEIDDKVLIKSDGGAAFHLANVVDDHRMEITHVIRGEEWVSSTPFHILLYDAFGWDTPEFAHVPLILGPDGKKLSKRKVNVYGFPVFPMKADYVDEDGKNVHIDGFKDENYEPDALLNFLVLLGWNPGGDKEIMTMGEMISLFDIDRINNSGAMFNNEKLKSFNAHYLRNKSSNDLLRIINKSLWKNLSKESIDKIYSETELYKIVDFAKERSIFSTDLYSKVSYFFEPVVLNGDVVLKNDSEFRNMMNAFVSNPCNRVIWTAEGIKNILDGLCDKSGIKIGKILPDLRLALTGGINGPNLHIIMEILGKDESLKRIENLLMKTEKVAN